GSIWTSKLSDWWIILWTYRLMLQPPCCNVYERTNLKYSLSILPSLLARNLPPRLADIEFGEILRQSPVFQRDWKCSPFIFFQLIALGSQLINPNSKSNGEAVLFPVSKPHSQHVSMPNPKDGGEREESQDRTGFDEQWLTEWLKLMNVLPKCLKILRGFLSQQIHADRRADSIPTPPPPPSDNILEHDLHLHLKYQMLIKNLLHHPASSSPSLRKNLGNYHGQFFKLLLPTAME
ncbi:hypothetical protein VP01_480g4, partial [Puccinia sorghi]